MALKHEKLGNDIRSDQTGCLWQLVRTPSPPGPLSKLCRVLRCRANPPTTDLRSDGYLLPPTPWSFRNNVCCYWPLLNHQLIGGTGTYLDVLGVPCCTPSKTTRNGEEVDCLLSSNAFRIGRNGKLDDDDDDDDTNKYRLWYPCNRC